MALWNLIEDPFPYGLNMRRVIFSFILVNLEFMHVERHFFLCRMQIVLDSYVFHRAIAMVTTI